MVRASCTPVFSSAVYYLQSLDKPLNMGIMKTPNSLHEDEMKHCMSSTQNSARLCYAIKCRKPVVITVFVCVCVCVCVSRSVMPDSLQPHGQQPTRLLCPFSRQEYWSGLPCPPSGDVPEPGTKPRSPALQVDSSPSELPGIQLYLPKVTRGDPHG